MTKIEKAYTAGLNAATARMGVVTDWYASDKSHDFAFNAPADRVRRDAAIRGWEAAALAIRAFNLTKRDHRAVLDRVCDAAGCQPH